MSRLLFVSLLCALACLLESLCYAQSWQAGFNSYRTSTTLNVGVYLDSKESALTNESLEIAARILLDAGLAQIYISSIETLSARSIENIFGGKTPHLTAIQVSADVLLFILSRDRAITAGVLGYDEGRAQGIGLLPNHRRPYALIRSQHSAITQGKIIAHEIGHLMGATHADEGLMQPHIDQVALAETFYPESLRQIREHFTRPLQSFISIPAAMALSGQRAKK